MVYYIDRLCALYPEFTINTLTVHRFLITAATVAAKGLSDSFWNNTTYARVGGVKVAELKLLELEFLYRVDWKIVPDPDVLVAYYQGLVERCPVDVLRVFRAVLSRRDLDHRPGVSGTGSRTGGSRRINPAERSSRATCIPPGAANIGGVGPGVRWLSPRVSIEAVFRCLCHLMAHP